jgi:hypothetical protein
MTRPGRPYCTVLEPAGACRQLDGGVAGRGLVAGPRGSFQNLPRSTMPLLLVSPPCVGSSHSTCEKRLVDCGCVVCLEPHRQRVPDGVLLVPHHGAVPLICMAGRHFINTAVYCGLHAARDQASRPADLKAHCTIVGERIESCRYSFARDFQC